MKIKSLLIIIISVVVIGMSATTAPAEEIERTGDVPNEYISSEEQNSEEPLLIAPNPNSEIVEDEVSGEGEIIPLVDRGEPVQSETINEDGSEPSLISEYDVNSKNSDDIKSSNIPVFLILGVVGLLLILLLAISKKK